MLLALLENERAALTGIVGRATRSSQLFGAISRRKTGRSEECWQSPFSPMILQLMSSIVPRSRKAWGDALQVSKMGGVADCALSSHFSFTNLQLWSGNFPAHEG